MLPGYVAAHMPKGQEPHWSKAAGSSPSTGWEVADPLPSSARQCLVWQWLLVTLKLGKNTHVLYLAYVLPASTPPPLPSSLLLPLPPSPPLLTFLQLPLLPSAPPPHSPPSPLPPLPLFMWLWHEKRLWRAKVIWGEYAYQILHCRELLKTDLFLQFMAWAVPH